MQQDRQQQLRHQYLEALGVESWLPVTALPGAQPSPDWVHDFQYPAPEIPFEPQDAVANARQAISKPAALKLPTSSATQQQGMNQARAALGLGEAKTPTSTVAEEVAEGVIEGVTASATQDTSQTVAASTQLNAVDSIQNTAAVEVEAENRGAEPTRFKLAFQRIGAVLVIDSMPLQGNQFGERYQMLAKAIVSSLHIPTETKEPFLLPWPMFASKTLDQGRNQAVITVQHKLKKELADTEIKAVLLFGEAAAQMVLDRHESLDALAGTLFSVANGAKALATSSLTEAMQLPGVKPQMWQQLQPMLNYLNQQTPD